MFFPKTFSADFNQLVVDVDRIRTNEDLETCRQKLCGVIQTSYFEQIVSFVKKMRDKSRDRLFRLNEGILHDFEDLDAYVRKNTNYAAYTTRTIAPIFCLDRGKEESGIRNEGTSYAFPVCRTGGLMAALRYMLRNSADIKSLVYGNGIEEIEEKINNLVQTANVVSWCDEDRKYQEYSFFLIQVCSIKKNINFDELEKWEIEKLKYALQIVCAYSVQCIEIAKSLQTLPIESIKFFFSPATKLKEAYLTLCINDEPAITFKSRKACNLHKLFLNPSRSIEIEELEGDNVDLVTKKKNARNDFDEANISICKAWYMYGFILGSCELVQVDTYVYSINSNFAHYIKPMK